MTIAAEFREDKIEEIHDLQYLKKYACPKVSHISEWYLKCVDCKGRKKCPAGQQAYSILNSNTSPSEPEHIPTFQELQRQKTREMIESIFQQKDPVKALLENSVNVKPQSIYQKVSVWRKNYPDLEEKYSMLEKVRFLWTKPYDGMKVPDILKMMYPEEKKEETKEPEKKEKPAVYSVTEDDDMVSLEDFLRETENHVIPKKEESDIFHEIRPAKSERETENYRIQELLEKLKTDKKQHEEAIREIDRQIDAIRTVLQLLGK